MEYRRSLWRRILPVFRPVERALLSALLDALPRDAAEIASAQLSQHNLVQRHGPEAMMYRMRWGKVADVSPRFPCKAECELARMRFRVPARKGTWTARFIAADGHFCSFVVRPKAPPRRAKSIQVISVELLNDPMLPSGPGPQELARWMAEAAPADYLELCSETDRGVVGPYSVLAPAEVYPVHLEDADYLALAEIHGRGMLGVKEEGDGTIYYLDYGGGDPAPTGRSLREAIQNSVSHTKGSCGSSPR